ncbi:Protein RALF-like 4 [Linum perenne]
MATATTTVLLLIALIMLLTTRSEAQMGTTEAQMGARVLSESGLGNKVMKKLRQTTKIARRGLQQRDRYISYEALQANNIPCGKHGNSYYNCSYRQRANPYTRGCTEATGCFRYTH